jgi:hypothetical protein
MTEWVGYFLNGRSDLNSLNVSHQFWGVEP